MPLKDPEAHKAYLREYAAKHKAEALARVKAWRKANPEKVSEQHKRYAEKHRAQLTQKTKNWRLNNLEKAKELARVQAAKQRKKHPEKIKADKKLYAQTNKEIINAAVARRKAKKLQRTPMWLNEDDHWMIEQAYELAALRTKMFGFQWHVDHVLPLCGKTVSGLHVPVNLQVITGVENIRKGNRVCCG